MRASALDTAGAGMALVFAPAANAVLGVAVLATVFTSSGGMSLPQAYLDGLVPAVWVGAAVPAVGAPAALLIPRRTGPSVQLAARAEPAVQASPEPVPA